MVAVEQMSGNSYRLNFSRDGENLPTSEHAVDGDTLTGVSTDARDDSVVRWTALRQ